MLEQVIESNNADESKPQEDNRSKGVSNFICAKTLNGEEEEKYYYSYNYNRTCRNIIDKYFLNKNIG